MNQLLAMRAFVRVVEANSFSRAADQLALPRSTVSKLLADLETHLGIKLIHRTTRAISPTSDGQEYYHHAARLLAEVDFTDNAMRSNKRKPAGHLRVDAPSSFSHCLLIPALGDFHHEYPDITLALGISDREANIVGEGIDCVIRAGKLNDIAMIGRKVAKLEYVTCATPAYLERRGIPVSPDDLRSNHTRAAYIFTATGKPEPLIFEHASQRIEIGHCEFSTNDGSGLKEMLLAGLGVGQHFRRIVQPYFDTGELVPLLENWSRPPMPLHVIYPPNRHGNPGLKAFIDWVIRRFGDGRADESPGNPPPDA